MNAQEGMVGLWRFLLPLCGTGRCPTTQNMHICLSQHLTICEQRVPLMQVEGGGAE